MSQRKEKTNFLAQGSILAVSGIIVRLIGLLYRIPVVNIIGEEGSGYYTIAFDIYNIALILSSYSLPLAVSKLMAAREVKRKYRESFRVFACAFLFAAGSGLAMAAVIFFGADWIAAKFYNLPGVAIPLKILAPTIFVCAILGVLRGLYQGKRTMIPTALSQILEQVVNAAVSIGMASWLMKKYAGQELAASYGASGSTIGTGAGALVALLFLLFVFAVYWPVLNRQMRRDRSSTTQSYSGIFKVLVWTIIPVILSQTIYQVSGVIDNSLFSKIMEGRGMAYELRSSLVGVYGSKYRTLINVPIAISQAVSTAMVPSMVASCVRNDMKDVASKIKSAIKFNMMIAIPAAVGMGVLAKPIISMLFAGSSDIAYQIMAAGALAVVFYALSTVTNGVLQGINRMKLPVIHSAIALVIHLVLVVVLLKFTDLGIFALVIGNMVFPLVVAILNWIAIDRELPYHQEIYTTFVVPFLSSIVMGAAAYFSYKGLYALIKSNTAATLLAIVIAVLIYGIGIILLKGFEREELSAVPGGRTLVSLLEKLHLM
ncbi:polysaccharide biosynthesis protein [Anaerolentibacter hominis]|uniref:putative polysaccharide biosynthesis protein n=1 Tax=Anaerolentibacter hominis TaxID=3079009 RepID=UPI0031B8040B